MDSFFSYADRIWRKKNNGPKSVVFFSKSANDCGFGTWKRYEDDHISEINIICM